MAKAKLSDVEQNGLLVVRQSAHRAFQIKPKRNFPAHRWLRSCGLVTELIRRVLPPACGLQKAGIGDPVEPRGEPCLAPELVQLAPRQQECFLREIIRARGIAVEQAAQLRAHHALMAANKLFKGAGIIGQQRARDQRLINPCVGSAVSHAYRHAG